MESHPKPSVAGGDLHLPVSRAATLWEDSNGSALNEVFLDQYTEVEVSSESEWLSNFVEECLSSAGNCLPPSKGPQNLTKTNPNSSNSINQKPQNPKKLSIPGKPRSQRGRKPSPNKTPLFRWTDYNSQSAFTDPPLLEQGYWLADSELLSMPRKEEEKKAEEKEESEGDGDGEGEGEGEDMKQQQPRRCSHCQAQKTPQWRAGPMGPKTLCNACGMRYFKSGRLLPEYRPAKSPTFLSFKHSNSHKKVLQMRMALMSSSTPSESKTNKHVVCYE